MQNGKDGVDRVPLTVLLANPRGFCAGVIRAIDVVERALDLYGPPVYVRHEIVHNRHVVEQAAQPRAVFVDELDGFPPAPRPCSAHTALRVRFRKPQRRAGCRDRRHLSLVTGARSGRRYAKAGRTCDDRRRPCRGDRHNRPDRRTGLPGLHSNATSLHCRSRATLRSHTSPRPRSAWMKRAT
jgi:hypothetical protein